MKAVMLSLRPHWCEKIFNGSKSIEVRKSRPSIDTPFKVYVCCTKGKPYLYKNPNSGELFLDNNDGYRGGDYEDRYLTGKVIGSFVCDRVFELKINGDDYGNYWHEWDDEGDIQDMCLSYEELETYLGKSVGYGWHISDLKIYDKPKELGGFSYPAEHNFTKRTIKESREMGFICQGVYITRPPQSWVYCEPIEEE